MNLRGIEVSCAKCHPKRPHTGVSHAKYQPENCTLGKQGQQHYVLLHVRAGENRCLSRVRQGMVWGQGHRDWGQPKHIISSRQPRFHVETLPQYGTYFSHFITLKCIDEINHIFTYWVVSMSASGLVLNCSRQYIKTWIKNSKFQWYEFSGINIFEY